MAREDNPVSLVPVDLGSHSGNRSRNPVTRPLSGAMLTRASNPAKGTAMKVAVLALVVVATKYAVNLVSMVTDKLNISSPKVKGILHGVIGVGVWIGGDILARKPFAAKYGLPVQSGAAIIGGVIVADALDRLGFMGGPAPSIAAVSSTVAPAPTVTSDATDVKGYARHHHSMGSYGMGGFMVGKSINGAMVSGTGSSHRPAFRAAVLRG